MLNLWKGKLKVNIWWLIYCVWIKEEWRCIKKRLQWSWTHPHNIKLLVVRRWHYQSKVTVMSEEIGVLSSQYIYVFFVRFTKLLCDVLSVTPCDYGLLDLVKLKQDCATLKRINNIIFFIQMKVAFIKNKTHPCSVQHSGILSGMTSS